MGESTEVINNEENTLVLEIDGDENQEKNYQKEATS